MDGCATGTGNELGFTLSTLTVSHTPCANVQEKTQMQLSMDSFFYFFCFISSLLLLRLLLFHLLHHHHPFLHLNDPFFLFHSSNDNDTSDTTNGPHILSSPLLPLTTTPSDSLSHTHISPSHHNSSTKKPSPFLMSPPRSQSSSLDVLGGTCSVLEGKAPPTVLNTHPHLLAHRAAVFMLCPTTPTSFASSSLAHSSWTWVDGLLVLAAHSAGQTQNRCAVLLSNEIQRVPSVCCHPSLRSRHIHLAHLVGPWGRNLSLQCHHDVFHWKHVLPH